MIFNTEENYYISSFRKILKIFDSEQFKHEQEERFKEYLKEKDNFNANPIHWSNNKRRLHGLNCLRGKNE